MILPIENWIPAKGAGDAGVAYGPSGTCRMISLEKDMNCSQVLKIIADHREALGRDFGVKSLALFGSVVRNEGTTASDVDLLVEFDGRPVGLFHLSRTQHYLESILGIARVDLVLRDGIKPALKERILREAIDAA
jgi:uncharacterized protein